MWNDEMAGARDRAQWIGTSSALVVSIAAAHDEIAANARAAGRHDDDAAHTRWGVVARLELAHRGDLTFADGFAMACACDDAMQAALVRRFGKRAVEARYDYATHKTPHEDVRWSMQAKILADEAMRLVSPGRVGRAA